MPIEDYERNYLVRLITKNYSTLGNIRQFTCTFFKTVLLNVTLLIKTKLRETALTDTLLLNKNKKKKITPKVENKGPRNIGLIIIIIISIIIIIIIIIIVIYFFFIKGEPSNYSSIIVYFMGCLKERLRSYND